MQNFRYENQGSSTYLVYQLEEGSETDMMSLGMLTNNKIPGLAPTIFTQMDNTKYIKYDVSSKIPAKQVFTGPVNKRRLLGVFRGIADAMISAEEYMIDIKTIIMDLDYMFTDVSTCETVLICLPILQTEDKKQTDLALFFKNIMFTTQFDQTENCDYVGKIINYFNSAPIFSLNDFKEVLESIGGANNINSQRQPAPQQMARQPMPQQRSAPQQPAAGKTPLNQNKTPLANPRTVSSQQNVPVQQKPQNRPPQNPQPFNVPQNNTNNQNAVPKKNASAPQSDENKISWFYLMQHYNKENAALYKAQKEAKKNGGARPSQDAGKKQKQKNKKNQQPAAASFSIPGSPGPSPAGFAIPGQNPQQPVQAGPVFQQQPQSPPGMGQQPRQPYQGTQTQPMGQPAGVQAAPQQAGQSVRQAGRQNTGQAASPSRPQESNVSFGETMVLGTSTIGATTVLNENAMKADDVSPYIIRVKNNEKIPLNKPVFRIGKERSYVDYFIGDNTAISRSHANIITREGRYFITDTNSTNHTYINGKMIQSNDEVEIKHGTRFRLANEDFEFRMY